MPKFVGLVRVSTEEQGESGLGLEAQRAKLISLVGAGDLIEVFVEVETGTVKRERPVLAAALAACKQHGARLVVAKLDRLSRNVRFILTLIDDLGHVPLFGDMPQLSDDAAGRMMMQMMASFAEFEASRISERTKEGLAAAKANGKWIGRRQAYPACRTLAKQWRAEGYSFREVSAKLAARGWMSVGRRTVQPFSASSVRVMVLAA